MDEKPPATWPSNMPPTNVDNRVKCEESKIKHDSWASPEPSKIQYQGKESGSLKPDADERSGFQKLTPSRHDSASGLLGLIKSTSVMSTIALAGLLIAIVAVIYTMRAETPVDDDIGIQVRMYQVVKTPTHFDIHTDGEVAHGIANILQTWVNVSDTAAKVKKATQLKKIRTHFDSTTTPTKMCLRRYDEKVEGATEDLSRQHARLKAHFRDIFKQAPDEILRARQLRWEEPADNREQSLLLQLLRWASLPNACRSGGGARRTLAWIYRSALEFEDASDTAGECFGSAAREWAKIMKSIDKIDKLPMSEPEQAPTNSHWFWSYIPWFTERRYFSDSSTAVVEISRATVDMRRRVFERKRIAAQKNKRVARVLREVMSKRTKATENSFASKLSGGSAEAIEFLELAAELAHHCAWSP